MTQSSALAAPHPSPSEVRVATSRRPADPAHFVQFYEDDSFLVEVVAGFVAGGIEAGEPVVLIATREHEAAFVARIAAGGLDVAAARAAGRLFVFDAERTLDAFMVDGMPDVARFNTVVGAALAAARGNNPRIRAFGEMVDVLWHQGNPTGAIALEEIWNDVVERQRLSLLCAYVMNHFYKSSDSRQFDEVCRLHAHVAPAETLASRSLSSDRDREIVRLQQRSIALEREIAERRRLEDELRVALRERTRAEQAHKDFLEHAVHPMHSVGPDAVILWANQAELDLLGYAREEYVGHPITDFHVDQAAIAEILARLGGGHDVVGREARVRCKDGSIKTVLVHSNVTWEGGQFVRTRCFTQDITARKMAADDLAAAAKVASHALEREKTARAEAERTIHFNEMFAGILGHDLRNPLSAITAGAHYLVRMNASEKVTRTAGRMISSSDRMARMIDQLLDFTRIRVGEGLPLHLAPMDLGDLCLRVKDEIEAAHPKRSVVIEHNGSAVGTWDADRLLQVLSNLVGNAASHGTLGTPISIRVDAHDAGVGVFVTNAGVVPEDVRPVLFEPFRGSQKSQRVKGLGLGLFITQQIVLAHRGTIEVQSSDSDRTTTFAVSLPRETGG